VTRRVALVRQHGATRSSRQARLARHVFRDVAEIVPEIDANPEHKRLNLYTQALLLLCRPPCWNNHGSTRSSRRARHAGMSRRDVTSVSSCACSNMADDEEAVEFGLYYCMLFSNRFRIRVRFTMHTYLYYFLLSLTCSQLAVSKQV